MKYKVEEEEEESKEEFVNLTCFLCSLDRILTSMISASTMRSIKRKFYSCLFLETLHSPVSNFCLPACLFFSYSPLLPFAFLVPLSLSLFQAGRTV